MEFRLSEEQSLLESSVCNWFDSNKSNIVVSDGNELWSAFADLGWLGLPFTEKSGGFGGGPLEVGLLVQNIGRHLLTIPYVSSIVIAGYLIQALSSAEQRNRLLPKIIAGEIQVILAHIESGMLLPWDVPSLRANRSTNGWVLNGIKVQVDMPSSNTLLLVSAQDEQGKIRIFLVDRELDGVQISRFPCLHGGEAADIQFNEVRLPSDSILGESDLTQLGCIECGIALGILASCWSACGATTMLLEQTAKYLTQRKQFGRTLAQFQVVQHRLAEMRVECMEGQACCESASMRAALPNSDLLSLAAATKIRIAQAADFVSKQAIQLHGAMGVCDELPIAPAFRWLEVFQMQYGRSAVHANYLGKRLMDTSQFKNHSVLQELL